MRRYDIFILLGLLVLASCHQLIHQDNPLVNEQSFALTKGTIPLRGGIDSSLFVSYEEIALFSQHRILSDPSKGTVSITPSHYGNYTTSYLLEYDEGWEIVSTDKRGPVFLAQSETGSYSENDLPDGAKVWIESLNEDIAVRWSQGVPFDENNPNEVASKEYWDSVLRYKPKGNIRGNRFNPAPLGDYVLFSTETVLEVYDSIPNLTTTVWKQQGPYNAACPLIRIDSLGRAPAGCVPVAGAQMLFFLHNEWGVPVMAPSYASCSGTVNNNDYVFDIPDPNSTTIWSQMNNTELPEYNKAYILVADVGRRVGADYGENGTGANTADLGSVFEAYGISCSITYERNLSIIRNNLLEGIPLIMGAHASPPNGPEVGHTFIIDGYVRYRIKTTDTYRWVWLDGGTGPLPEVPDVQRVYYSSPIIQMIKMNWGWGTGYNSTSYAISGDWEPQAGSNYNHNFKLLYDFSPNL